MRTLSSSAHRRRLLAVALLTIAALLAVAALPPIPQPEQYHDFADQRAVLGVPHALNVVSNQGFLIVGAVGLGSAVAIGCVVAAGGWISGHSVKHVLATVAARGALRMLRLRSPVPGALPAR